MEPISSENVATDLNLLVEAADEHRQSIENHILDRWDDSDVEYNSSPSLVHVITFTTRVVQKLNFSLKSLHLTTFKCCAKQPKKNLTSNLMLVEIKRFK